MWALETTTAHGNLPACGGKLAVGCRARAGAAALEKMRLKVTLCLDGDLLGVLEADVALTVEGELGIGHGLA